MDKAGHLRGVGLFLIALVVLLPVCFAEEIAYIYDRNGNLVEKGDGLRREYNGLNQLVRIWNSSNGNMIQEYVHDPVEERIVIKKTFHTNGSLRETVYYFDKEYIRTVNSSGSFDHEYVFLEGQLVAQVNPDGSKYYIHSDHLGSATVITNQSGDIIENTNYDPFGRITSGGEVSRLDYEGKEFDSVVGDYDFHFRKFLGGENEPPIFAQPDNVIPDIYNPQDLNRYSFENNNPYRYKDPDGHGAIDWIIGWTLAQLTAAFPGLASNKIIKELTGTDDDPILINKEEDELKRQQQVAEYIDNPEYDVTLVTNVPYWKSPYYEVNKINPFGFQASSSESQRAREGYATGTFSYTRSKSLGFVGRLAYIDSRSNFHQSTGGFYPRNPVDVRKEQSSSGSKSGSSGRSSTTSTRSSGGSLVKLSGGWYRCSNC